MSSHTYDHLATLRAGIPFLADVLVPGTPRRWAERDLTPEQRLVMDHRVLEEREAKRINLSQGLKSLGEGKAPLRLDVLDTMRDVTTGLRELEEAVCDVLGMTPLRGVGDVERITRLVQLLDRVESIGDLADHVHEEARRLRCQVSRAIGDGETVRKLNLRCPVCNALSMRAFLERDAILCVNTGCVCDGDGCPCQWERPQRHQWPLSDGVREHVMEAA